LVALSPAPHWALLAVPRSDHCREIWEQVRHLALVPAWSQAALLERGMREPLAVRSKRDTTPFMRNAWPPKATGLRDHRIIRRLITKVPARDHGAQLAGAIGDTRGLFTIGRRIGESFYQPVSTAVRTLNLPQCLHDFRPERDGTLSGLGLRLADNTVSIGALSRIQRSPAYLSPELYSRNPDVMPILPR